MWRRNRIKKEGAAQCDLVAYSIFFLGLEFLSRIERLLTEYLFMLTLNSTIPVLFVSKRHYQQCASGCFDTTKVTHSCVDSSLHLLLPVFDSLFRPPCALHTASSNPQASRAQASTAILLTANLSRKSSSTPKSMSQCTVSVPKFTTLLANRRCAASAAAAGTSAAEDSGIDSGRVATLLVPCVVGHRYGAHRFGRGAGPEHKIAVLLTLRFTLGHLLLLTSVMEVSVCCKPRG